MCEHQPSSLSKLSLKYSVMVRCVPEKLTSRKSRHLLQRRLVDRMFVLADRNLAFTLQLVNSKIHILPELELRKLELFN